MLHVDEGANGQQIDLVVGQRCEIVLPENPTTGYRWWLDAAGGPVCRPAGDAYAPTSGATGGGGGHRWEFEAVQAGRGTISLLYRRPWEQAVTPARAFSVDVRVQAPA